jgi:CxxC motif-containing protein (DUF1111 family)
VTSELRLLTTGASAVGRFGWKAQHASLFEFSGDAYVNEMGITNPVFPIENCPQGDCTQLDECNPAVTQPNDNGDDVRAFADFMTLLAPPPRGEITTAVSEGESEFQRAGCADCHVRSLTTGPNAIGALSRVTFSAWSDFLLHDMGSLGDGIQQNEATGALMRTAPLWGLRKITSFLHDGRATTLPAAIEAHDGQGAAARNAFQALTATRQSRLLAFLNSL